MSDPQQQIFDSLQLSSQQPGRRRAGLGFGSEAAVPVQPSPADSKEAHSGGGGGCSRSTSDGAAGKRKQDDSEVLRDSSRAKKPAFPAGSASHPDHHISRCSIESHYDQRAAQSAKGPVSVKEVSRQRLGDRSYKLKRFHNDIKWRMIQRFSYRIDAHLDLACGRGGDIRKWNDAGIRHVRGVDISRHEVAEATRRLEEFEKQQHRRIDFVFEKRDDVGERLIPWQRQYQSVSCMFAAHYFFVNEATVKMFVANASAALEPGGHFYGTIACGKSVLAKLNKQDSYKSELLSLKRNWPGQFDHFQYFGSGYTFAIVQTVTSDDQGAEQVGEGCEEYLVFFRVLTDLAAKYDLWPVKDLDWNFAGRRRGDPPVFEPGPAEDKYHAFRHFAPHYGESADDKELEAISKLYAGFVFRKGVNASRH